MATSARRSTAKNLEARRSTVKNLEARRSTRILLGVKRRGDSLDPIAAYLASPFARANAPKVVRAFSAFDHGNRKRVDVKDIYTMVRVLGLYPTDAEIMEIIAQTEDPEFENYVQLNVFLPVILKMMEEKKYPPDSPEVLMQAFEYFDSKKKGYLEEDFFKLIMTISPEDEEGINRIEEQLEGIHKGMEIKVSLSDEKIPDTPPPVEEVVEVKPKIRMLEEEEEPKEVENTIKVEPLSNDELSELLRISLDKDTNTIFYGDLVLKFLGCQNFKESTV